MSFCTVDLQHAFDDDMMMICEQTSSCIAMQVLDGMYGAPPSGSTGSDPAVRPDTLKKGACPANAVSLQDDFLGNNSKALAIDIRKFQNDGPSTRESESTMQSWISQSYLAMADEQLQEPLHQLQVFQDPSYLMDSQRISVWQQALRQRCLRAQIAAPPALLLHRHCLAGFDVMTCQMPPGRPM